MTSCKKPYLDRLVANLMKLTSLLQFGFFGGPEKILVAGMDLLRGGGGSGGGAIFMINQKNTRDIMKYTL